MGRLFARLYLLIVAIAVVALTVGNVVTLALAQQKLDDDYRRLAKGTFHLIARELQQAPRDTWAERIRRLDPEFGYPLSLVPLAAIDLPERQRTRLLNGEIVVIHDGDMFYQRVGDAPVAVAMGPIGTPWVYHAAQLGILAFLAGGIGVAVWFWVRPLWRGMVELERTAEAFGRGVLSVRAAAPRASALAVLAGRFNAMAERIERLIDSHKDLTRAVAHELRTPIARLRFAKEMARTDAAEERTRYLDGMERDIVELDALISELLDYARLERDAPVLDVRSHALADWVRRTVDGVRASAASVTFHCEAPATGISACFDDRFMTRALGNVLRNAARHARAEVRVSAAVAVDTCVVHVDDDGPGVPASERERIFEPFVRLDANRDGGGYGLGLAIARRILRWHDGDIGVHASPLGGARFSLRWPATPGHTSLP